MRASRENGATTYFPFTTSPNTPRFDYTADGVRRSIEDRLQRMGLDGLDRSYLQGAIGKMTSMGVRAAK